MGLSDPLVTEPRSTSLWFVYLAFIFPACAGFLFGYDIGGASGAVNSLSALQNATSATAMDTVEKSLLTSASLIGATVGSVIVFWIGEPLGRRRELMAGSALYTTGALASQDSNASAPICAPSPSGYALRSQQRACEMLTGAILSGLTTSLTVVTIARIIYGLGIALSMHSAPVYISEMAPANVRGLLVALKEGFIVGGILCGFAASAIGQAITDEENVYRVIWLPSAAIGVVVVIGMSQMPPSPRWLLLRGMKAATHTVNENLAVSSTPTCTVGISDLGTAESGGALAPRKAAEKSRSAAMAALRRFRRGATEGMIEAEVAEIEATLSDGGNSSSGASGGWAEIFKARRALVAGLGLVALQQLTGQPSVLYYQESIFADAGFGDLAAVSSIIVGAAKLVATLTAVLTVDRFGRRPLLLVGTTMMLAALALLGSAFLVGTPSASDPTQLSLPGAWPPLVVAALVLYVCGYQVGFGPIAWLIISEVFPLRTRTRALSLAVIVNFAANLIMTFALEPLQSAFDSLLPGNGQALLFFLYGVLCVVSLAFIMFFVPETKGKSLEEIEAMFASKR